MPTVLIKKNDTPLLDAGHANWIHGAVYKWQPLDGNRFYDDSDTSCHLSGVKQVISASWSKAFTWLLYIYRVKHILRRAK